DALSQCASSRRNGSTSVTRPIDCKGWCSTTRSTAAGSMSTHTVFAAGASMLATASECWTVASIITCVTSENFCCMYFLDLIICVYYSWCGLSLLILY